MIPLCEPVINGKEWDYIKDCLDTGWVSSVGSYVDMFEKQFNDYIGAANSVVTVNGTAAIALALEILGIGLGDEVIVPSMTFIASVNPIIYCGAAPVFSDITEDTWVMDVSKVEELINDRTKAIIPVHVYGNMVDMEALLKIADKYGIPIIEDATEALGSKYRMSDGNWYMAGTLGRFGAFSFNGNKLITTGAGGMLVTKKFDEGKQAKYLSNQSKSVALNGGVFHETVGYNYRMPNLLAAMGVAQLEKIDDYLAEKSRQAKMYNKLLAGVKGIIIPAEKDNVIHSHWLYSVLVTDEFRISRDDLMVELKKKGIISRPFFMEIHKMAPYLGYRAGDLKLSAKISNTGINLPSTVGLSDDEIKFIVDAIIME